MNCVKKVRSIDQKKREYTCIILRKKRNRYFNIKKKKKNLLLHVLNLNTTYLVNNHLLD